jgi:hypothetical protein
LLNASAVPVIIATTKLHKCRRGTYIKFYFWSIKLLKLCFCAVNCEFFVILLFTCDLVQGFNEERLFRLDDDSGRQITMARILGPFWREKIRGFCRKSAPPYFTVHEFISLVGLWSYFPTNPRLSNWLWMRAKKCTKILQRVIVSVTPNARNSKYTNECQRCQIKINTKKIYLIRPSRPTS